MALLLVVSKENGFGEGDLFQRMEWVAYDTKMRWASQIRKSDGPDPRVPLAFVSVGDEDQAAVLDGRLGYQFGLYWPRHVYGRAVRELRREGAKGVAFDVLFYDLRPDHAPVRRSAVEAVTSDEFFAGEIRQHGRVLLAANSNAIPPELFRTNAWGIGDVSTDRDADSILRRARVFIDYTVWHPAIVQQARALDFELDRAVVTEKSILFRLRDGGEYELERNAEGRFKLSELTGNEADPPTPPYLHQRVWQLGVALAALELDLDLGQAKVELEEGIIVLPAKSGGPAVTIPVDRHARMLIDWAHPFSGAAVDKEPISALLARDVLREAGEADGLTNRFAGKLVVVGSTSTGNELADLGATPLDKETFLVSKHWNIARTLITGGFISRVPVGYELGLLTLLTILSAWTTWKADRMIWATTLVGVYCFAGMGLSWWVFLTSNVWLPVVIPAVAGPGLAHAALISYRVAFEMKERQRVKTIFSRIVAPEVVQELLSAEQLVLGGAQRHVSVLFADVRGFTEFTDTAQAEAELRVKELGMSSEEARKFLDARASETLRTVSEYLGTVAETIKRHRGTLDKYIGDCVMAFWGAPVENPHHAADAVRAAIEVQRGIKALNVERAAENERRQQENVSRMQQGRDPLPIQPILKLGTGINAGKVTVGLMGSEAHIMNFTVFGREVNLASRLEGVSGRDRIVISEAAYFELKQTAPELAQTCVELPSVSVKGIRSQIRIFLVSWEESASEATAIASPDGP